MPGASLSSPPEQTENTDAQPTVCVFCASSPGNNPLHLQSATTLGKSLTDAGYKLVYGGGTMGIMGELAKTVVSHSGSENVEGIIPRALMSIEKDAATSNGDSPGPETNGEGKGPERKVTRQQLKSMDSSEVIDKSEFGSTTIVPDMHTRKAMMAQRVRQGGPGSGFVALAGGYGTIEEVMEVVTWNQLGIHQLPVIIVNIDGYWDGLLAWVRRSVDEGFIRKKNEDIIVEVKDASEVVAALKNYKVSEGRLGLDWSHKS